MERVIVLIIASPALLLVGIALTIVGCCFIIAMIPTVILLAYGVITIFISRTIMIAIVLGQLA